MTFVNRISQVLHEEHRATVALMERLEQFLARQRGKPPAAGDQTAARLLSDLSAGVEDEVRRHFDFEEQQLFAFLDRAGDSAIGSHLASEHEAMRPLGSRLAELARSGAGGGFDQGGWDEFQRLGSELCERMLMHVQKEEMALLPMLDEMIDAETEAKLYDTYVGNR